MIPACTISQNLVWRDTMVLVALKQLAGTDSPLVKYRINQDLEYFLTCSSMLLLNRHNEQNVSQVSLLQHVKYQSRFNNDHHIKIVSSFVHDLGIQYFFDSITRFQPDENTLDTRLEISLTRNFTLSVSSRLSTRIFNSYNYTTDQTGNRYKTRSSSFFTPLLGIFAAGFGWTIPNFANLSFGLSSVKLTFVLNKSIFDQLNTLVFYGVPKDKNHLLEYGLSMHLLVDRDFSSWVHWNCDVLLFKNYLKPIDLVMDNLVGIRINKYLKTSIKTHISYEAEVSRNLEIENLVSLGFWVSL